MGANSRTKWRRQASLAVLVRVTYLGLPLAVSFATSIVLTRIDAVEILPRLGRCLLVLAVASLVLTVVHRRCTGCCGGTCGRKRGGDCPKRVGGGLVLVQPKSAAGRRSVALPPQLVDAWRPSERSRTKSASWLPQTGWRPGSPARTGRRSTRSLTTWPRRRSLLKPD